MTKVLQLAEDYNYTLEPVLSSRGKLFYVLTPEMPRIDDILLDAVIYLYPSADEAEKGVSYGGAGFLTRIRSEEDKEDAYVYAVTNRHVVDGGCTVVRMNTQDGKTDAITLGRNQWIDHPTEDLSVALIEGIDPFYHKVRLIRDDMFLTKFVCNLLQVGAGDDVYMLGRFVSHDGKQHNQPFVQSGIISLMPTDVPVEWDDKGVTTKTEELLLVEMRSLSGCSGSPVLFSFPLTVDTSPRITPANQALLQRRWLVGVDCGHFKTHEKVVEVTKSRGQKYYGPTTYEAESNAGQMMVVPAWKLRELLEDPRLAIPRKQQEAARAQMKARSPIARDSQESEKQKGDES